MFYSIYVFEEVVMAAKVMATMDRNVEMTKRLETAENTVGQQEKLLNDNKGLPDGLFLGLCFMLPAILMALIWKELGITYAGKITPLVCDMKEQFVAFFASLRYIVNGESSFFYTWGTALGGNNLGMIAYYIASPLSWITIFYELKDLPDAIYLLTILKISLCGLNFGIFSRFGLLNKKCGIFNVTLACCYALMSYNVIYSSLLMWLDGVIFLPLVLLGIEKIIEGKKGVIYFGAILSLFVCNYYTSYMVGVFVAFYIVCRIFMQGDRFDFKQRVEMLLRFGIVTILAIGVASPMLLVAVKSVEEGRIAGGESEGSTGLLGAYDFDVIELVQKFLPTQYDGMGSSALPSIYCGGVVVLLALLYFFQKNHSIKEKVGWALIFTVPFLGFLVPAVDYVWHVFQYPNSFPYRYAFLVPMVVLILASYAGEELRRKTEFVKILTTIGIIYTFAELYFNGFIIVSGLHREFTYSLREEYEVFVEQHESLVEQIKKDEAFFRTEFVNDYLVDNSAFFFGVNGASSFTSTYNGRVNDFLCDMGSEDYFIFSTAKELTPLGDSLLGIKYRITKETKIPGYENVCRSEEGTTQMYLHKNEDALSVGYLVDDSKLLREKIMSDNPYENQNRVLEAFGVEDNEVFRSVDYRIGQDSGIFYIEFEAPTNNDIYFYINGEKKWVQEDPTSGMLYILDRKINIYLDGEEDIRLLPELTNHCLGNFEAGECVRLVVSGQALEVDDFYIYEMDDQKYKAAVLELGAGQFEPKGYQGGEINGNVNVFADNQVLFTTIPADGGHQVKVDGKEIESIVAFNTFLAIPLEKGEHAVEISYISPGFRDGIIVCAVSVALSVLYFFNKKLKKIQGKGCKYC